MDARKDDYHKQYSHFSPRQELTLKLQYNRCMNTVGFTFISIATGKYTDYLLASIESYRKLGIETSIQWLILTDNVAGMRSELDNDSAISFTIVEIDSLRWPDATLLRYRLIASVEALITGSVLVYLDADMQFVKTPTFLELDWKPSASLYFTLHPGYYYENVPFLLSLSYYAPKTFLRLLKIRLIEGGFGTWENKRTSAAFVSRKNKKKYVCGGIWFGDRNSIITMCKILNDRTQIDISHGVIARFHDESHLNWFLTTIADFQLLPPENCFAEGYANLRGLSARVIAVEKENSHF